MHVDDVGSNGDMYGHRNTESSCRGKHARSGMLRTPLVKIARYGLADAQTPSDTVIDGPVQKTACLIRHAERAWTERLIDVLGRRTRECHFEVVNDRGTVGGDGR